MRHFSQLILAALIIIVLADPTLATQNVTVKFTEVPASGAGPQSQGDIAGTVTGLKKAETYKVVIYAHTDAWYVQPLADDPYTGISPNGVWSNWTHLGHRYAALIVRPSFQPPSKTQSLPQVGGDVIGRFEVSAKGN